MTRRERLERKLELRQEWADKAKARAESSYNTAHKMAQAIPFGQPILVGHHSEKRDRNYRGRIEGNFRKAFETLDLAKHHEVCADGIERALDSSIFSDDRNAIEALEARIAQHEAEREKMKTVNKLYRKGDAAGLAAIGLDLAAMQTKLAAAGAYWGKAPHLPYEMANLGGRITADRKRLEWIKQQQGRARAAEASETGVTLEQCNGGYVRVTFASKPGRTILDALKTAGFWWGKGSWAGKGDALPQSVRDMLPKSEWDTLSDDMACES